MHVDAPDDTGTTNFSLTPFTSFKIRSKVSIASLHTINLISYDLYDLNRLYAI